ncbi:hypothetical protein [Haladaptatus halobius]|uniref:hypothetical protein n=1 Tax=Haladaptatus halobius TaxID=2884875 RepID=UPI001D0B705B|nr:hypothetical protein [Haladaptatus halobius]
MSDSPTIENYDVQDNTNPGQGPRYTVIYTVSSDSQFEEVKAATIGRENGGAAFDSSTQTSSSFHLSPGYGQGTEFTIKLLVYDDDGAVVAIVEESDTAQ